MFLSTIILGHIRQIVNKEIDIATNYGIILVIQYFPVAIKVELSEMEIPHKVESNPDSLFAHTLQELLTPDPSYPQQDMWIPFDMAERKKKFPKAFEELKVYMDHIRKYPIE